MSNQSHDSFEQRSRALFDDSVASLDGATRSKLTQARYAALSAAQSPTRSAQRWLLPVGSAAALALATVVTMHMVNREPAAPVAVAATVVDDLEIVTADADLDMLKDMDFYLWLDAEEMSAPHEDG